MGYERNSRLVYSTETGRVKDEPEEETIKGDGVIRVQQEKKGRGGKAVTCIYGLPLKNNDLKALAKTLKKQCGTGGAVKDGVIEIQGEVADKLVTLLDKAGYSAKRSGG